MTLKHAIALALSAGTVLSTNALAQNLTPVSSPVENIDLSSSAAAKAPLEALDAQGRRTYLVSFIDAPVASYRGGVPGLAATHPGTVGVDAIEVDSPNVQAYLTHLESKRAQYISEASSRVGRSLVPERDYSYALNAVAVRLSPNEAEALTRLRNVKQVEPNRMLPLQTDAGPQLIDADAIWAGSGPTGLQTQGEGVVVGILDSGLNFAHPSFAETTGGGYTHTNPNGSGNFLGWCDPSNPNYSADYLCNDKLIGLWDFADAFGDNPADGPDDNDGHGTHVAGTVAGNPVTAEISSDAVSIPANISGVAPRANVIGYDVCVGGSCPTAAVIGGIEQSLIDGVNVLNESIGIGGNAFSGAKQQAYLGAVDAGVVAVRAAGNSGPGAATVGPEPAWTITVGASTHGRSGTNTISFSGGDTAIGPYDGAGLSGGFGPADIVYAGDFPNPNASDAPELCGAEYPAGTFSGQIVICDRGSYALVAKGENVAAGGAGGMIIADNGNGLGGVGLIPYSIPTIHVDETDSAELKTWLTAGSGHQGTIGTTQLVYDNNLADFLAGFSSRGPAPYDMLKPDLTAPGVSILAPYKKDDMGNAEQYRLLSGTSMASPHVAGAAALLRKLHPSWTPTEIRSALMTTVEPFILDQATGGLAPALSAGSGRINVERASRAGLVLNESRANFEAADPAAGGDPSTLNVPSMFSGACYRECSWQRTVKNPNLQRGEWVVGYFDPFVGFSSMGSVDVSSFTLNASGEQTLNFSLDVEGLPTGQWTNGYFLLQEVQGRYPNVWMPVVVNPVAETDANALTKGVDADTIRHREMLNYTLQAKNFDPVELTDVTLVDTLPAGVEYVPFVAEGSVGDYDPDTHQVTWVADIPAADIGISAKTPADFGYLSLAGLGVSPIGVPSDPDEGCWGLGADIVFGGQSYTSVIMSVNGTLEIGQESLSCARFINTELPSSDANQNLLAPLWADFDLTPGSGAGQLYAANLTAGPTSYQVYEWENAQLWGQSGSSFSFQIWIETGTDNIWYTYGPASGIPDFATIGFQESTKSAGDTYFLDGDGMFPSENEELAVSYAPGVATQSVRVRVPASNASGLIINEAQRGENRASATTELLGPLFYDGFSANN